MDRIYLFLIRNDVWIYIVSVMGLIWYTTEFIRAQRLLRRAMFNLERETATRVRNHALSFMLFFAATISIVYYVNNNIAPELPAELLSPPTPTPNLFATPLASPTPLGTQVAGTGTETDGEGPVLAPTVTLPGAEAAPPPEAADGVTPSPEAPPTPFADCNASLTISEPLNGSVVFRTLVLRGTADTGELHRYMIELNGPQTAGNWAPIFQDPQRQPVINGDLGAADLSQWQIGPYLVRMRALDANGAEVGQCTVQVTLDN